MFSIVCVFDKEEVLKEWLLPSLNLQTAEYESILLDNSHQRFSSAAEALNYGGSLANGDYIMFVHQDVRLEQPTWLQDAEHLVTKLSNLGVAGVAGVLPEIRDRKQKQRNLIKHGCPPKPSGVYIDQPEKVQVLDELLFIVPRAVFISYQFDPVSCPAWHLYAVDYCLGVLQGGFDNYVLPLPVWHKSTGGGPETPLGMLLNYGVMPKGYYKALGPVLKKHKDQHANVYTTCGTWNTRQPVLLQRSIRLLVHAMRYIVKMACTAPRKLFRGEGGHGAI